MQTDTQRFWPALLPFKGDVYLWQLFRDPPEHMVVEIPGLGQVLDVL